MLPFQPLFFNWQRGKAVKTLLYAVADNYKTKIGEIIFVLAEEGVKADSQDCFNTVMKASKENALS